MIPITARTEAAEARRWIENFPALIDRELGPALDRAAIETTREAKRAASKYDGFGQNTAAIHWETPSPYLRIVATGVKHGIYIEEGIKANQPKMPDVSGLYPWVHQKHPELDFKAVNRLTYVIARSIQRKGLKARPFMAPTAEKMADRVEALISQAVERAIAGMGAA